MWYLLDEHTRAQENSECDNLQPFVAYCGTVQMSMIIAHTWASCMTLAKQLLKRQCLMRYLNLLIIEFKDKKVDKK